MSNKQSLYIQRANNKGVNQTAWTSRLVCTIVPSTQQNSRTVKPVLSGPSKRRPKMVFETDYRLMQVKSIAECSKRGCLRQVLLYSHDKAHIKSMAFYSLIKSQIQTLLYALLHGMRKCLVLHNLLANYLNFFSNPKYMLWIL